MVEGEGELSLGNAAYLQQKQLQPSEYKLEAQIKTHKVGASYKSKYVYDFFSLKKGEDLQRKSWKLFKIQRNCCNVYKDTVQDSIKIPFNLSLHCLTLHKKREKVIKQCTNSSSLHWKMSKYSFFS